MGKEIAMIVMIAETKASFVLGSCISWILSEEMLGAETLSNVYFFEKRTMDGCFPFDFRSWRKSMFYRFYYLMFVKKVSGREPCGGVGRVRRECSMAPAPPRGCSNYPCPPEPTPAPTRVGIYAPHE